MAQATLDVRSSGRAAATHNAKALIRLLDDGICVQQHFAAGVDVQLSVDDVSKDKASAMDAQRIASKSNASSLHGWPSTKLYPILEVAVENKESASSSGLSVDGEFPDENSVTKLSCRARLRRTRLSGIAAVALVSPEGGTPRALQ
eukprot:TRINITY_DN20074_c0_g1_i1.p2 TRINITY_DN20074_c0_g1~~TRINITY_DN20074_c0_g1_i1.p2  ORF type:complete len:146 (-),score=22.91 TRINITY_DN20074_c0_g1_i1:482-919(-)